MTHRSINLKAHEVRGILAGRQTQLRRVIDVPLQPATDCHPSHQQRHPEPYLDAYCSERRTPQNPRGMSRHWCWWQVDDRQCLPTFDVRLKPGDLVRGREAHTIVPASAYRHSEGVFQRINPEDDYHAAIYAAEWDRSIPKWQSAARMPNWASRLTLEVTEVRAQRLQEISEEDAEAEGAWHWAQRADEARVMDTPREAFAHLWDSLNEKRGFGWNANPWVIALTFKAHQQNIDDFLKSRVAA